MFGGLTPRARFALGLAATALAYFVAAKLSLSLALVGESVTPLWPPTGIALVAFLVLGSRVWPAVTVAAFLVNLPISPTARAALAIAAGNTAAPAAAAWLLRLAGFRHQLDRTRDAVSLVALGALAAMTVSATVGSLALERAGALAPGSFWSTWAVWWAGDAMGILAVAPFLLSVRTMRLRRPVGWSRGAVAILLLSAIGATAWLLNVTTRPLWVAVFPLLVLIAWRYEQRGAGAAALIVIGMASWAAAHHAGPFPEEADLLQKMFVLQVFNAAVALTSFFFAAVVAERAAARSALERSTRELYLREHRIAETLQRSLLPEGLPDTPDVAVAARYIPATGDVEVGGDWYDIIPLADGRLGLAIGDVAGHGVAAAAAMGQIRMALRAYAHEALSPAPALDRLNALIAQLQPGVMATLVYAHLDPEWGTLTLAKAGHPPPLVVGPGARTTFVSGGLAPPLGVAHTLGYDETTIELDEGATLLLYTDGLIERRAESLTDGMERLAAVAAGAPFDLDQACDHIVASLLGAGAADDTAILAVRRLPVAGRPFRLMLPIEPARLPAMRRVLGRWLRHNGVDPAATEEIALACTEACTNAIQHAYDVREGRVAIDAGIADGVFAVTVRDYGSWRHRPPGGTGDNGKGMALMRAVMDSVEVVSDASGTEVRMSRRVVRRG